jgi:uncharacterized protein (DUF2062 family)
MIATWVGMWVTGFRIGWGALREIFQLGMDRGFMSSNFWGCVTSQWGLLLSFLIGSLILCILLSVVSYPLSLKWIKFCRLKREKSKIVEGERAMLE